MILHVTEAKAKNIQHSLDSKVWSNKNFIETNDFKMIELIINNIQRERGAYIFAKKNFCPNLIS